MKDNKKIRGLDEMEVNKQAVEESKLSPMENAIYKAFNEGTEELTEEEVKMLKNPSKEEIRGFGITITMMYQEVLKAFGLKYSDLYYKKEDKEIDGEER